MIEAAGVLIVRGRSVLMSPRGAHLGWIGGACLPGESPAECAQRKAREEIGCEVEILHSPVTYLVDLALARFDAPAPLLRTGVADVFRARPRGEPRPVDVPALVWVPVDVVPELGELMPSAELLQCGAVALGPLPDEVLIRGDTATGLLRTVVTHFGPTALD